MTTLPVFPVLAGQGWSVHKKPVFSTLVSAHASGREVRDPLYLNPIWRFELTFNALDGTANGGYGGTGASSLQTLMSLFLQCQGQFGRFLYYDSTDFSVSGQQFGTGDGVTTSFPLTRSIGGFTEPIVQPLVPLQPTLFQVQGSIPAFAPNNLINQSQDFAHPSWNKVAATVAAGIADPFGANGAQTVTAVSGVCSIGQSQAALGSNYVSSVWVRRRTGSGIVQLSSPTNGGGVLVLPLTSSWQRFSLSGPPFGGNVFSQVKLFAAGDAIDIFGAQLEQSTLASPGPYFQTLASSYFGAPWVTVAGVLVESSSYSLSQGIATFTTAPPAGASLQWTGYYAFVCRFESDDLDFEQFMLNLWRAESVKFRSLRPQ